MTGHGRAARGAVVLFSVALGACGSPSTFKLDGGTAGSTASGSGGGAASGASGGATAGTSGAAGVDGGAGAADAETNDGADGEAGPFRQPGCPDSPTTATGPCPVGLVCEYRDAGARPTCLTRLTCNGTGAQGNWNTTSDLDCGGEVNATTCPATFSSVPEGGECLLENVRTCTYDEGRCACVACSVGAGPLIVEGMWACREWASQSQSQSQSCPAESPLAGTACGPSEQFCTYDGAPSVGGNYQCKNGYWAPIQSPLGIFVPPVCPAAMSCGFTTAPTAPADAAPGAAVETRASAAALAKYDALVGRFLRGDVKVYKGTLSALSITPVGDNVTPPFTTQAQILGGAAIALLDVRPTNDRDWYPSIAPAAAGSQTAVLVMHGIASRQYVVYGQVLDRDPDVTWTGIVRLDNPMVGYIGDQFIYSCKGCAPALAAKPDSLTLDHVTTRLTGTRTVNGMPMDIQIITSANAELGAVAPCTLRWKDLARLNTAIGPDEEAAELGLLGFVDAGDEMVLHDKQSFVDGPLMRGVCAPQTNYSIDLWVKKADLAAHGVRNFMVTSIGMVCPP
jgi:hypothetical protein